MDRMTLLLHEWDICLNKEDWYPPLKDALQGVTVEQADWRPEGQPVNTIWENVLHLIFYKERFLNRLTDKEAQYPAGLTNDDTFAVVSKEEFAWKDTIHRLETVHQEIRGILADLPEEDFDRRIPTSSIGLSATSLIMHDAYHTGQIIFIRKLQGSWPSKRYFE